MPDPATEAVRANLLFPHQPRQINKKRSGHVFAVTAMSRELACAELSVSCKTAYLIILKSLCPCIQEGCCRQVFGCD